MRETRTETGRVRGVACGWPSITAFYGIPYAAPPVGGLRWRPPQPAAPWEGVRDCARPSARCPQLGVGKGSFYEREFYPVEEPMDEDCLYLNVWTPAQEEGEKLPVIFWVHGGAFMTGYGHSAHFDGEPFARQGVILVTINYRLNIFAWMTHPQLSAESENHTSGNYGLLDQVAALELTGIPAVCLNSAMTGEEYRAAWGRIRSGECRLVYIAPERLDNEGFLASITQREISLVAVDEAHCISQWGQDFRPSYLRIREFVDSLPRLCGGTPHPAGGGCLYRHRHQPGPGGHRRPAGAAGPGEDHHRL